MSHEIPMTLGVDLERRIFTIFASCDDGFLSAFTYKLPSVERLASLIDGEEIMLLGGFISVPLELFTALAREIGIRERRDCG